MSGRHTFLVSVLSAPLVPSVRGMPSGPGGIAGTWVVAAQAGAAAAAVFLLSLSSPLQSAPERRSLGTWLMVASWPGRQLVAHKAPPWLIVLAVVLLVTVWLVVAAGLHRQQLSRRLFAAGCALWCCPFLVSVPVFSRDAYAYVAQGTLLQRGFDPYVTPVARLGRSGVLGAVDPVWRHTVTPYGPFGLRIEQAAVWLGGGEVGALLVLRLLCVGCVALAGACVWVTCSPERRQLSLWLLLSPLVLVHLVAGLHLDAIVLALLALSAAAAIRRQPAFAIGFAVAAGEVKASAFAIVPVFLLLGWRSWRHPVVLRCLAVALTVGALGALAYWRDPFGWVAALRTPGSTWDPFAPASTMALAFSEAFHHARVSPPWSLVTMTHVVAIVLAGAAFVGLLVTRRRRPVVETCAWVLLVSFAGGPAMWAWYLTGALPFLLAADRARMRTVALVLGSAGLLVGLPLKVVPAQRLAVVAELAGALALVWCFRQREQT